MQSPDKQSISIKPRGGKRPGAGRPLGALGKITRPLRELAALHSEDCIAVLVELRDHAEAEQVRLAAANSLLDRGHGKPRQEIDLSDDGKVTVIINRGGNAVDVPPAITGSSTYDVETVETL